MEIDTALDGNPSWQLRSIDDVDELYSALSFSDPKLIVTPDGSVWEVWVDTEDETMQLHRLRGQSGCRQIEADSLQHAFSFLQDGAVVHTIENTDSGSAGHWLTRQIRASVAALNAGMSGRSRPGRCAEFRTASRAGHPSTTPADRHRRRFLKQRG